MKKEMTPAQIEKKRAKEKETLELMIGIYCRGNHKQKQLCPECEALRDYALMRTQKCPMMATKTFCSACKIHCYAAERQEQIRAVMRYAGPRMLLYHPIPALRHCFVTMQNVWKRRH